MHDTAARRIIATARHHVGIVLQAEVVTHLMRDGRRHLRRPCAGILYTPRNSNSPKLLHTLQQLYFSTIFFFYSITHETHTHTHTHTHTRLTALFSETTRVSRYQIGKTNLDFTEARDSEWQWHELDYMYMQVCNSLQTDNHASTPPLSFFQAGCPSCRPTNSVKALKAKARTSKTQYSINVISCLNRTV